ncbi:MAG: ATP-binding protein [Betaproteobacteria bacterium]
MIGDLEAAHWRALMMEIDGGVLLEDAAGRVRLMNRQFIDLFHLQEVPLEQELLSLDVFAKAAAITFLDPDGFVAGISELRQRRVEIRHEPFTTVDQRSLERDVVPMHHDGAFVGILWIFRDVSSAQLLEALAEQKAFYDRILEALPAQLAVFSPTGTYEYVSPSAISDPVMRRWILGRTDIEYGLLRGLPSEVTQQRRERIRAVIESKQPTDFEESFTTRSGELRHYRRFSTPILDEHGEVRHVLGYGVDITDQRRMEQQLLQSQKMDAVGRLAGGIAHDFNNLLTVINGFTEALRDELSVDDERRALLEPVLQAGNRASELTSQLLAFSRQAIVETRVLDLNAVVSDTTIMLRRLVGESIDMRVQLEPGQMLLRASAGHLQQVLMNLAVNARDAMPQGGELLVETATIDLSDDPSAMGLQLPRGRYVELRVADTGTGMTEEVRRRLFEPFFTTKEVGRGTGLGLSTVYGIVVDAGGQVLVESQLGRGSVFRVILPALVAEPLVTAVEGDRPLIPRGTETVLVAEDESSVRDLVSRILTRQGYTVLLSVDGRDALRVAAEYSAPIHLLLSDVVMPQLNGSELAAQLLGTRPDIKVLFLSGYTDDDVLRNGVTSATMAFMQKPFTVHQLATRVREALDART